MLRMHSPCQCVSYCTVVSAFTVSYLEPPLVLTLASIPCVFVHVYIHMYICCSIVVGYVTCVVKTVDERLNVFVGMYFLLQQ